MESDEIILTTLIYKDMLEFDNFGSHSSRLYDFYNLNNMNELEKRTWYLYKRKNNNRHYFSIRKKGSEKLLGYCGIKNIDWEKLTGEIGIVLDPNFMEEGVGTMALELLLAYFFEEKLFQKIFLEVNQFNKRAIHCYEKLNFRFVRDYLLDFEVQDINIFDEKYREYLEDFIFFEGILYTKVHLMELKREDFFKGGEYEV